MPVKEILDQQRASGFPAFVGSDLNVRLPLREQVLNDLLKSVVFKRGPKGPLTGLTLQFHSNNRFTVNASIDQFLLPKNISIDGAFAPTTDFSKDPRLLILLAPSTFLGLILKLAFGAIEEKAPFLSLADNRLFVDIPMLLAKAKASEYLPLLQTLKISTSASALNSPGMLMAELNLHINPQSYNDR